MKPLSKPMMPEDRGSSRGVGGSDATIAQMSTRTQDSLNVSDFGLSPEEKSSIEADITAQKPIGDTPAYRKFLTAIFPNTVPEFPYLANYDDAVNIVSKLSVLFGRVVRLPDENEAVNSIAKNHHFTGYRNTDDGGSLDVGRVGYAWLSGDMRGEGAPYVWRNQNGSSDSGMGVRPFGFSVIPVFE